MKKYVILFSTIFLLGFLIAGIVGCSSDDDGGGGGDVTLNGTVTDADTGSLIEGATVSIGGKSAVTNIDGYYLIESLQAGTSEITVSRSGYQTYQENVVLIEPTTTKNVALTPGDDPPPSPTPFKPISSTIDWQAQDYTDSQAITAVTYTGGSLKLDCSFVGGDAHKSNGEAYLNMNFVQGLESQIPYNMQGRTITATVRVPEEFVGEASRPNGVQVFVKDVNWKNQYGKWVNITRNGKDLEFTVTISPTNTNIPDGYTTNDGFDATKIQIIGVKFGIGAGSADTYNGNLYITGMTITPAIYLNTPPDLPNTSTSPVFSSGDVIEAKSDGIYLNGKKWYVTGCNYRMIEYGQNFGVTDWFPKGNGVSIHPNYINSYMGYLKRTGVKVVRVFLLCDGRTLFDIDGNVTGYNSVFKNDVTTLLSKAQANGLKVEFVLVDYLIAGKEEEVDGVWIQGRSEIITNSIVRSAFRSQFLVPFLKSYGNHEAVLGFDLMNEPEWLVSESEGGGWENVDPNYRPEEPLSKAQMTQFFTECIQDINANTTGKLITVGVSCPNVSLVEDLAITHYSLHHYPWMDKEEQTGFSSLDEYIAVLPAGKPWILEEFPTKGSDTSVTEYYTKVLNLKGSGAYLWNYKPGIDDFTVTWGLFNNMMEGLRIWVDSNQGSIY